MAFVAHLSGIAGMGRTTEMHVSDAGYAGINRVGADLYNVALVVPQARAAGARGDATQFFFDALETFPGVRGRMDPRRLEREVLVTGPFAARASRVSGPGALLVGDAADFFDPFTGQGIYSALRGAELAAETAEGALRARGPPRPRRWRPTAPAGGRRSSASGRWND